MDVLRAYRTTTRPIWIDLAEDRRTSGVGRCLRQGTLCAISGLLYGSLLAVTATAIARALTAA